MTNKQKQLDEALLQAIEPATVLHLTTSCRAATRAIQRIFRGSQLGLTLVMCRVGGGNAADLVESGLVKRVIAGSYGAATRSHTGPLPQIQRVHASGKVDFQHWSFYSLTQRLAAAAQGLPFVPTHSLTGSTMGERNAPEFQLLRDPTGSGQSIGAVSRLQPDVSIVHALAADEEGNTILVPPLEDAAWGAKACAQGAIVTAEKIVSRDFIRRHSHLVRIPARYVRAVCEVPFGGHPGSVYSPVLPEVDGYLEDDAFNEAYFAATREPSQLEGWLQHWVYGASHDEYLALLGAGRLRQLRDTARRPVAASPRVKDEPGALTAAEKTVVMATREIVAKVRDAKSALVLVGVGLSEVPGSAAKMLLKEQGIDVALAMGHGFYDFEPFPGYSEPDLSQTQVTTDSSEMYGTLLGGRPGEALALLGAAQIDRFGNLNSTLIGGRLLTGSGGSNDAASTCDTIVVTRSGKRKLVEKVEYITCPGNRVSVLVTDKGVFTKQPGVTKFQLSLFFPDSGQADADALKEIADGCGWELEFAPDIKRCEPPDAMELATIRGLMPARYE